MNCSPNALLAASVQYRSLTKSQLRSSIIYLLCEWANHLAPPFRWTPEFKPITWYDSSGLHSTDYTTFLATADIASVYKIDAGGLGITSLENLSSLPALTDLEVGANPGLATLDASGCDSLAVLICDNCNLTSLNITGCTSLVTLNCYFNFALATITGLTTCTSLQTFDCDNCALTSLNCSGLASLATLNCSSNASLTTLTLTGCTALVTLDCNSCALTSLVCTSLTSLATLNCSSNSLTALTLTGCSSLSDLNCNQNPGITSLTLTGLTALVNLDFSFCTLTTIDLTPCINLSTIDGSNNNLTGDAIVGFSGCTVLTSLSFSSNPLLTKLVAPVSATITTFLAFGCGLTEVDLGTSSSYTLVDLHNNALPATPGGIDRVLSDLKNQDLLNAGTCDLTGGTNAPPTISCATPGSDCFVLINTGGWTISTN